MKFINSCKLIFPSLFSSTESTNYLIAASSNFSVTPDCLATASTALLIYLESMNPFPFESNSSNTPCNYFTSCGGRLTRGGFLGDCWGGAGLESALAGLAGAGSAFLLSGPESLTLAAILVAFLVRSSAFLGLQASQYFLSSLATLNLELNQNLSPFSSISKYLDAYQIMLGG